MINLFRCRCVGAYEERRDGSPAFVRVYGRYQVWAACLSQSEGCRREVNVALSACRAFVCSGGINRRTVRRFKIRARQTSQLMMGCIHS